MLDYGNSINKKYEKMIKGVDIMKRKLNIRRLKNSKGFSMVELMVGLLIVAVVSAAALAMLGGVLNTGKVKADRESAETIRRAVQNYINASNDLDLSMLGVAATGTTSENLINVLSGQVIVTRNPDSVQYRPYSDTNHNLGTAGALPTGMTAGYDDDDEAGVYGPFLDGEQRLETPQQNNRDGWRITVDDEIGQVIVVPNQATATLPNNVTIQ